MNHTISAAPLRKRPVSKRRPSLRVLVSSGGVPLLGECIRCSRKFKAHNDSDRKDIRHQFEVHLCSAEDVHRTAMRIVSRAGVSFFS
jgi:hypothetical protein